MSPRKSALIWNDSIKKFYPLGFALFIGALVLFSEQRFPFDLFDRLVNSQSLYGIASWYEAKGPTCATYYFPAGTLVKVVNLKNGKEVICRVKEAGPNVRLNRMIDLSKEAFSQIADPKEGLITVRVTRR